MASSAKTAKITLVGPKKRSKKYFLRKFAIFQPLMRGTAKRHGFLIIGTHFVARGVLGHMRQIHPIFTCIEGKLANFRSMGFPRNQRWIMCRWTLQDRRTPPEHPRDTTHAFSARCLQLQSALYRRSDALCGHRVHDNSQEWSASLRPCQKQV